MGDVYEIEESLNDPALPPVRRLALERELRAKRRKLLRLAKRSERRKRRKEKRKGKR